MSKSLKELREKITLEIIVLKKKRPYSHNIISITLRQIANQYGKAEANKAIRDLRLNKLGWDEEV